MWLYNGVLLSFGTAGAQAPQDACEDPTNDRGGWKVHMFTVYSGFSWFFFPLVLIDLSFWTVILLFKNKFLYYAEKNPQRVLSWMGAFMEPELWTLF